MNRVVKWLLIICGGLFVVIFTIILIAPSLIDINKYRPQIENAVSEATGRPFTLGEDLRLSLFPWASVTVNDVHLGNPPGFEEKDLLRLETFEVRVKFMPLVLSLFKDIQVKHFILKGARIVLETGKDGKANWEGIGKTTAVFSHEGKKGGATPQESKPGVGLRVNSIAVGELAITEGSLLFIDHARGKRFQISDITLKLKDFSLDRPIHLIFSADANGHPLSLNGSVGPLGKAWGKGTIPMDLSLSALKQLDVKLKGSVSDVASSPRFDLSIEVSPFSPRKLASTLGQKFPIITKDPNALTRFAFNADLRGDTGNVTVSDGVINIDDSTLKFSCKAGDFSRPDVKLDLKLDEMDVDRYLAPEKNDEPGGSKATSEPSGQNKEKTGGSVSVQQKTDYGPLRRLVLTIKVQIGKLKVCNARIQDFNLKVAGKNGVFNLEPLSLNLYEGSLSAKGLFNVKKDVPESRFTLDVKGINASPLLKDLVGKDILEGKLNAEMNLRMKGDDAVRIKKSLNGKGDFFVEDGAIKGIDLVSMVRNTDGAYGLASIGDKKAKTEFSNLQVPFTIKNGVLYTDNTRMVSTLLRVQSTGKADLVNETLDFKIEPTFVTTKKEDAEKMKHSEVMVPVLVTGNLSDPKFRLDLRGIAKEELEEKVFQSTEFKEIFEKEELKPFEDDAKRLLKGIIDFSLSGDKK
ncbi:MAG: AsmA family protein [Deltaproteobacteria bacterium]|nr:AsmA family protein [Deltaproteobacteria bacterium]